MRSDPGRNPFLIKIFTSRRGDVCPPHVQTVSTSLMSRLVKGSIYKILVDPDDGNSNEIVYYEKRGDSRIPFESYHSIPLMRIKDMLYQLDPQ